MKFPVNSFLADTRGGVIIYVALAMPVLVGGMGLGGEAGYRYYNQRLLQHAADFAAYTGAVRKFEGDTKTEIDAAALAVAVGSEYDNSVGTITVNVPPLAGAFTGDDTAVEVILTETRPRLFSAIFSDEEVVVAARAVAAAAGLAQKACILALNETESGAVTVTGSTNAVLSGCSVASNSTADDSFDMQGLGGYLTTDCVQASGGASTTANLTLECEGVLQNAAPVFDPYYWVVEPSDTIPCQTTYPGSNPQIGAGSPSAPTVQVTPSHTWAHPDGTVLPVMKFCDGLRLRNRVNFAEGVYIVENGGLIVNNGAIITAADPVSGDPNDVTFYFGTGGYAKINGGAQLNLKAPEDGPYSGLLFFGTRETSPTPPDTDILGNAASSLTGAIYMPAAKVTFSGNSDGSNGCTQVIADTIELTGNSDLAIECEDDGTEDILTGQLISVVE